MSYDSKKYSKNLTPQETTLSIYFKCSTCGVPENLNGCQNHTGSIDKLQIWVRGIPRSIKNQIISQCLTWAEDGKTHFDTDQYRKGCLKYIITQAPWGETSETFLLQAGDELWDALDMLIPLAFEGGERERKAEDIKKGF